VLLDATVDGRTIRVEVREREGGYRLELDGKPMDVDLVATEDHFMSLLLGADSHEVGLETTPQGYRVHLAGECVNVVVSDREGRGTAARPEASGPARLWAPMPGRIVRVLTEVGKIVEAGQGLVVVEAMKMENELRAPRGGKVVELRVGEGQAVEAGALLVVVG
jgi:biotin carboxyl carrier protein